MKNQGQKISEEKLLSFLYQFRNSPDWALDLTVQNVATRMEVDVKQISKLLTSLEKKQFALVQTIYGYKCCKIVLGGIMQIETHKTKKISIEGSTRKVGFGWEKTSVSS
jgi:hypothetical protein